MKPLTKEQLEARLRKLAEAPPPKPEQPAAMCYKMARPPDTADYVCPRDGSRTHYSDDISTAGQVLEVEALRDEAERLPGVAARIDDSEFCRKCTPKPPDQPTAILIVTLPDGTEHRKRGVGLGDMQILREFLAGKTAHAMGRRRRSRICCREFGSFSGCSRNRGRPCRSQGSLES